MPERQPTATSPHRRPRPVLTSEEDPWLFSDEELLETPSRVVGMPKKVEDMTYYRTSLYIRRCASGLGIPTLTVSIATTFMRRFYMLESITDHSTAHVASACLFVACKVAETHKRLKDFIAETVRRRTEDRVGGIGGVEILDSGSGYSDEKNAMLAKEAELMRVLNFDLTVDTPFPYVTHLVKVYVRKLRNPEYSPERNEDEHQLASQNAWCFVSESEGMFIHLRFDPREIATAACFLAVSMTSLPLETEGVPKYHEEYGCDVGNIETICTALLNGHDGGASFQ